MRYVAVGLIGAPAAGEKQRPQLGWQLATARTYGLSPTCMSPSSHRHQLDSVTMSPFCTEGGVCRTVTAAADTFFCRLAEAHGLVPWWISATRHARLVAALESVTSI